MNSSLNRLVLARESTYGVAPIDFLTDPTTKKGYAVNQSSSTPADLMEDANKVFIEETTGSQIEDGDAQTEGDYTVTASMAHNFAVNDALVLMAMLFQNDYAYTATITDGSITAISNNVDDVTLTLTDAGTLAVLDKINISGRADSLENGNYIVQDITGNDITIIYVGGFNDADLTGTVAAVINTHSAKIESVGECPKQLLDSSYTLYQPKSFDKPDCSKAYGDQMTGLALKTLNLDLYASTYSAELNGHQLNDGIENVPKDDTQYKPVLVGNSIYYPVNRPVVKIGGVTQKAVSLTSNWTLGLDESTKTKSAGRMDSVVVDRVTGEGEWSMLFKTEDEANNYSNTFYKGRNTAENGAVVEFGIEHKNGASMFIGGKVKFSNEKVTKEPNGWLFSTNYKFCKDTQNGVSNITLTCKNGYNYSLAELFRTTA